MFTFDGLDKIKEVLFGNSTKQELRLQILSDIYESIVLAGGTDEMIDNYINVTYLPLVQDVTLTDIYEKLMPNPRDEQGNIIPARYLYGPVVIQAFLTRLLAVDIVRCLNTVMELEREAEEEEEAKRVARQKQQEYLNRLKGTDDDNTETEE